MNKIFQKRLSNHLIEMTKYLKYVFNDFFVIALMFFVGGLGYAYSGFLKQLSGNLWWERPVAIVVLLIGLQLGGLATLVKSADKVFMAPKEYQFHSYFSGAFIYSLVMGMIIDLITWFVLMPFLSVSIGWGISQLIGLLLVILLLKTGWMAYQVVKLYFQLNHHVVMAFVTEWVLPLIILVLALYFNVWAAALLALLITASLLYAASLTKNELLNWNYTINHEDARMNRIYHFYSLFTEVPELSGRIHRRKYLDPVFKLLKRDQGHLYSNLYLRSLLRDSGPGSLYFRLVIIALILVLIIPNQIIGALMTVIFVYLVGFQLIPFYEHFDSNVFTHIYPVNQKRQLQNFRAIVQLLLLFECFVLLIAMLIARITIPIILITMVVWLIEGYVLTVPYLNKKAKQIRN